ncbi:hypothetical protein O181_014729 [Austropuccinia psidii MF-1]|uniref:Sulfhydryl oxidase n=1 Tax=Austropuccinia psidii MF-1 TaxID=1389203 RepID=A0A9Q3GQ51_9BASI|nr:hypothetical protein [Austropuccinia psidii MF-1]
MSSSFWANLSKEKSLGLPHSGHSHSSNKLVSSRLFFVVVGLMLFIPTYFFVNRNVSIRSSSAVNELRQDTVQDKDHHWIGSNTRLTSLIPSSKVVKGSTIMSKMENATAKAELGRATWKFLHTMAARFPEKPTEDEREALKSFIYLFSRLYPCGDCARHFQELLKEYPPQTSSRITASMHLCSLHNKVNKRLGKPQYNCGTDLLDDYDCGCGSHP